MGEFRCYGENAFTFLFFKSIHDHSLFHNALMPALRQFGTGNRFPAFADPKPEPHFWLFPNFGRRYGFGEPDALIVAGQFSFWFEVETRINLRTDRSALNDSLLQLARFHFLHSALARASTVRPKPISHQAIIGLTISNDRTVKRAVLKEKGHPVLKELRQPLRYSESHYVLLTQGQPQGLGSERPFEAAMGDALELSTSELNAAFDTWASLTGTAAADRPKPMPQERSWYSYWEGPLKNLFREHKVGNPLDEGGYAEIPKG